MNNVFDIESFTGNENLFIAASAGTGKTYTIQQVVGKLVAQGMNLNQILIVTYTEKAAGELKDRIRKKIEEEFKKDSRNIYLQQALHDVQGAPIGTIHSFCQKVTQEFAYEADVPLKQELIDESAVEELIQKSIRDVWAHEELFKCFVKYNGDLESFTELLKGAIASYIPETVHFAGNMELRLGTKDIDIGDVGCMAEAEKPGYPLTEIAFGDGLFFGQYLTNHLGIISCGRIIGCLVDCRNGDFCLNIRYLSLIPFRFLEDVGLLDMVCTEGLEGYVVFFCRRLHIGGLISL